MTIFGRVLLVSLFFASAGFAQPSREAAATSPLDSVLFLLAHDELDCDDRELPDAFFKAGRYDDAISTVVRISEWDRVLALTHYGTTRLAAGDRTSATKFAIAAYETVRVDPGRHQLNHLGELIKLLAGVSRTDLALKIVEGQKADIDNEDLADVVLLAEAYRMAGDPRLSRATIQGGFDLIRSEGSAWNALRMVDLLLLLDDKDGARLALEWIEQLVRASHDLDSAYLQIGVHYLSLGDAKKAESLWKLEPEHQDALRRLHYSSILIREGRIKEAESILRSVPPKELEKVGLDIVRQYVKIGKLDAAEKIADAISPDADDYDQQAAYVEVADAYIVRKQTAAARSVLEKAFKKAKRIKFADESHDSIGASAGSRKWIYLTDIGSRFERIGDTEKALSVRYEIRDPHPMAKEKLAIGLADFAQRNAKRLSQKRIDGLFSDAFSLIDDLDDDEDVAIRSRLAEVKALRGQMAEASNVLAELIEKTKGEGIEDEALIRAGEIFATYKLPLTDRLQVSLNALLEEHGL